MYLFMPSVVYNQSLTPFYFRVVNIVDIVVKTFYRVVWENCIVRADYHHLIGTGLYLAPGCNVSGCAMEAAPQQPIISQER